MSRENCVTNGFSPSRNATRLRVQVGGGGILGGRGERKGGGYFREYHFTWLCPNHINRVGTGLKQGLSPRSLISL